MAAIWILATFLPVTSGLPRSSCSFRFKDQLLLQQTAPLVLAARWPGPDLLQTASSAVQVDDFVDDGALKCNESQFASQASCPDECPFSAQDSNKPCHFMCVTEAACGVSPSSPSEGVADHTSNICRRCKVYGCKHCAKGHGDACAECHWGYRLDPSSGVCYPHGAFTMVPVVLAGILGVAGLFVLAWYVDLRWRRPATNLEVLECALEQREQLKMRDEDAPGRPLFPLSADVHNDRSVGGAGFLLHMDFQAFVVAWAFAVLVGWLLFAHLAGDEVHSIGTGPSATSKQLCSSIHKGRAMRDAILMDKAIFLGVTYLTSFAVFVAFAARQRDKFRRLDAEAPAQRSFAVVCTGFPTEAGHADLEKEYQEFLEAATGERLVGVSICWDKAGDAGLNELVDLQERRRGCACAAEPAREAAATTAPPSLFARVEAALGLDSLLQVKQDSDFVEPVPLSAAGATSDDGAKERAVAVLTAVSSTGSCFAVFHTQAARDRALAALSGLRSHSHLFHKKHVVRAKAVAAEPDAVFWAAHGSHAFRYRYRMAIGIGVIFGAVVLWAALFYLPYAYYTYVNYSTTGHDVSLAASLLFTALVLGGNQVMYLTCASVADMIRPRLLDEKEMFYTVAYTFATLLNVFLDIGVLLFSTYFGMVANKVRNDEGVLLEELHSWEAVLESYPLQKFGGDMLYKYNVWGCFVLPFLLEPVLGIYLPYHFGCLLVRSRAMPLRAAVSLLACGPVDLSRYADIVMNVTLMVLALFLSAGYVWRSMLTLILGLGLIYAYDRVRAVRHSGRFCFSTNLVDVNAHRMLALPCALLAACFVFQLRLARAFGLADGWTFPLVISAFVANFLLHQLVLSLVFGSGLEETPHADSSFEDVSKSAKVDWFTGNKVHCLRTRYVMENKDPLDWIGPLEIWAPRGAAEAPPMAFSAPFRSPSGPRSK